ncbi:carboxylesterase [Gluconobacter thailandicus]|nr:carboxylesterase [Gluconobacter thailandicus]
MKEPLMTQIKIESGTIEGFTENGILTFLSVPYAAPIVPGKRFAAPQDVTPWTGVRSAHHLGAVCPQIPTYGPVGKGATSTLDAGEDFLTLNIRSPAREGKAPVLVWLHGGGYAVGSGNEPLLQTGAFAASGIVEITLNYRLGALGFLSLDGAPENRGLLDIIKALEWVQKHIALFGGDPERVTLAGRSAGGFAVSTLMAMPAAKGLFSRTMIQSGATPAVLPHKDARLTTQRFLKRLGQPSLQTLEEIPIHQLLAAQQEICNESYEQHDFTRDGRVTIVGIPFQPVIDAASLPLDPETAAAQGLVTQVPVMIGTTSAEYLSHSSVHSHLTFADTARLLDQRVQPLGVNGIDIVNCYRNALPHHDPLGIWRAVAGDLVFQNPTTRYALALSKFQPVHKYLFGGIGPNETGAAHGAELANVWWRKNYDRTTLPLRYQDVDHEISRIIHNIWCEFISSKKIAQKKLNTYSTKNKYITSFKGIEVFMEIDPFFERHLLWK